MNREVVREWVEALRSGKYKQGTKKLRTTNDEYCCLGVLCELAVKHGVIHRVGEGYGMAGDVYADIFELPYSVTEWSGIKDSAGSYYDVEPKALSRLNDDGMNFSEIANIIESNPEGLFRKEEE